MQIAVPSVKSLSGASFFQQSRLGYFLLGHFPWPGNLEFDCIFSAVQFRN